MVFKTIRENIIKKKTYLQIAKYITYSKTVNMVKIYLDEIGCGDINACIVLESYLIRYQATNMLLDTELDNTLLKFILQLHKNLENVSLSYSNIHKSLKQYKKLLWFCQPIIRLS